jgi:FtsH-binding integral membrane protein
MKPIAFALAAIFFVAGILYGMGTINFFTQSGPEHAHHITHLIICWVLALLCLIWARFQTTPHRH